MRRLAVVILAVAVAAPACGGDDEEPRPPAAERPDRSRGQLTVEQRGAMPGSAPHVRIVGPGGEVALDQRFAGAPRNGRLRRLRLPAGSYELETSVRPPADACRTEVGLRPAEAVTAIIRRRRGRPCSIALERTSFEDLVGRPVERAARIARGRGFTLRTVERDGEDLVVTQDLRFDRVNVAVADGRVTEVRGLY